MTKLLKRSPHFGCHIAHGAKTFMDFAGWEMPDHFSSLAEEVKACRTAAVLFDGHQMGEIYIRGRQAHDAVQKVCATDIKPVPGRCFYTSLLNEQGGIVDDLVALCLDEDQYLLTAAAFNVRKTPGWLRSHVGDMDIEIDDQTNGTTIIEIQGPKSREILQTLTEADISNKALPYFRFVKTTVAGIPDCLVARLGVTGELGYEIVYDPGYAWTMYESLVKAGEAHGMALCGSKTVGIFRLEKVYHIYTREIDEQTNPMEAGLDGFINLDKDFIGREALLKIRDRGVSRKLVGYEVDSDPVVLTPGTPIEIGGAAAGNVTFAAYSPTLERVIGLGYVPPESTTEGTPLTIVSGNGNLSAKVVGIPFFDPGGERIRI